jgi:hypothetical protein
MPGCCARAASGQAAVARRDELAALHECMAFLPQEWPPATDEAAGVGLRTFLTTQRTAGAWADLNCSESLARPDRSSGNSLEINKTLREWIETVGDDAELQEVYDTERHLLYAACTRARDHLLITSVEPASEFLDDLRM